MARPSLIATRGLPGSGKTTWARGWVAEDIDHRARVNRDDLRETLYGRPAPLPYALEESVSAAQHAAVRGLLEAGTSVVVDDTHLRARYLRAWEEIAADSNAEFVVNAEFINVPLDTCIARDQLRERVVGEAVIREMAARLKNALRSEAQGTQAEPVWKYVPDESKPSAWIVDIDGTLAHTRGRRSPYDYTTVRQDDVDEKVRSLVRRFAYLNEKVIIVSGREEKCMRDTELWLLDHNIPFNDLFMRSTGDQRNDAIIKFEIFRDHIAPHYNVRGVLDDRNRVVKMWRSLGLLCCQVAPGAF